MTRTYPCLAVVLAAGSVVAAQRRTQQAAAPDVERFVLAIDALRQQAKIPGLSVAVVRDGALVVSRGLGFADVDRKIPAAPDTPYDIASVTKPISAVTALKLAEAGALDLDRPLATYSEWAGFCRDFSQQPSVFAKGLRCDPAVHTLRHLLSHTATGHPGEQFSYNPLLYSWASRPIRAATGVAFSSLVDRYVFAPAKMTRSARRNRELALPANLAAALAPPHLIDASGAVVRASDLPPQGDGAAGGVVSTVLDLASFDIALDNGDLISPASRQAMMTPGRSATGRLHPYGLGWFVQRYEGRTLVWHAGWWEKAYSALYLKVPDARVTLILLANSEGVWWNNPLDGAEVERSPFAQAFLRAWAGTRTP